MSSEGLGSSIIEATLGTVRRKKVAFLRELQVAHERPPHIEHWDVTKVLETLTSQGRIYTRKYKGHRWYYDTSSEWLSIKDLADRKAGLVKYYINYPNEFTSQPQRVRYDDYSEYLVENALVTLGFVVMARNTAYFNGVHYFKQYFVPGRPPDLDFTALTPKGRIPIGISVKNKLDYPSDDEVDQLVEICEFLKLRPVLVTRIASGKAASRLFTLGGGVVMFKRWLLPPEMPRGMFNQISDAGASESLLEYPLSIYRRTPDMLLNRIQELLRRAFGE